MFNSCSFIGNLGADPEVRTMSSGDKVANIRIACSERWKNKDGEKQERTTWVPVVIWGPLAGIVEKYLHKGSKVHVVGKFTNRKWTDQSGNERYATEIVLQGHGAVLNMLDGKSDGQREPDGQRGAPAPQQERGAFADDLDDDIPFITSGGIW